MQEATNKYQYLGRRIATLARQTPTHPSSSELIELADEWAQLLYEFKGAMAESWQRCLLQGIREGMQGVIATKDKEESYASR
jgi:hypothetical protein